ncbi:hypothetical protein [Dactylosporangium sp. CA-233914]|uniref:hypothetical protein n=1 Tax=Dactylosporangium sp. CA-233914 TaxID=3239934 RepID=UPI003D8C4B59
MVFEQAHTDEILEKALWSLTDDGDPSPALELIADTTDVDRREQAVAALGAGGVLRIEQLRELAAQQPYYPERWLLLGASLSAAAWSARESTGHRPIVTDRLVQRQQALIAEARTALRQAATLSRDDPVPWSELAGAVICAPLHRTEVADVFKRACVLAPDLYAAHTRHLTALTRRWYGSQHKVVAFAQVRTAERPDGHPLHALVALAHIEGYVDSVLRGNRVGRFWRAWRYFANAEVRRETDAASARLLAASPGSNAGMPTQREPSADNATIQAREPAAVESGARKATPHGSGAPEHAAPEHATHRHGHAAGEHEYATGERGAREGERQHEALGGRVGGGGGGGGGSEGDADERGGQGGESGPGGRDLRAHPWAMAAHQAFAAFYHHAHDPVLARAHLERAGDRAAVWPWRYFGDPEEQFATARAAAGL